MTRTDTITADWIAVDWGTSNMRAWAMSRGGSELARGVSNQGMGQLDRDGYEAVLLDVAGGWLGPDPVDIVACGMVGARQGWVEAPYATTPCAALTTGLVTAPTRDPRLRVHVIPGVRQMTPADVMRGEETQIAGFLSMNPRWDGVICLPGTHSKWAQISAAEIVSFRTAMTGELFSVLSDHTVLRHSLTTEGFDDDAFLEAVEDTLSRPERLAALLFSIRAEGLIHGQAAPTARARLSGFLLGAELAATRPYWLGQQIALIGADKLATLYARALEAQGAAAMRTNATAMTVAGLKAAHATL